MPCRLMDDLEGEIVNEKLHECALGHDILSADLDCEYSLLMNIRQHCVFGISHDVGCFIRSNGIGKVPKLFFNVVSECILTLVCDG